MPPSPFSPLAPDVVVLLDLSAHVFRSYHAISPLSAPSGEPTNATFGFVSILERLLRELRPSRLGIALDSGRTTFRSEMYPEYKANRPEPPEELLVQLVRSSEIARAFTPHVWQLKGVEADDLLATAVRQCRKLGYQALIVGADKDLMQLVGEDVRLWDMTRDRVFGPSEVAEKFGVRVDQLGDFLALTGDSSDNVPGVPRIGPKTAAELLNQYQDLKGIFANVDAVAKKSVREALREHQDLAWLSRRLVELRDDCDAAVDVQSAHLPPRDLPTLFRIYQELGFTKLAAALQHHGSEPERAGATGASHTSSLVLGATPVVPELVTSTSAWHELLLDCERCGRLGFVLDLEAPDQERSLFAPSPWKALHVAQSPERVVTVPIGQAKREGLAAAEVRAGLERLFATGRVSLTTHGAKSLWLGLLSEGLVGCRVDMDAELASYLLDPSAAHDLDSIVTRNLGEPPPVASGAEAGAARALALRRLTEPLTERVEAAGLTRLLTTIELPLTRVLAKMERRGVLVDTSALGTLSTELEAELGRLEAEAHAAAGHPFNPSSPRQLETILFDELGLRPLRRTKTVRSTDAATLEALASEHPLPRLLLEHRQLAKLKGTYVDTLPSLVSRVTGRVHTSWEQTVAATGRLSSSHPNLQNIPIRTELGRSIRRAFVAPHGMTLVSADYSQIELRILAHLSADPRLIHAFESGADVHTRTAMEVYGVAQSEVTHEMRQRAKAVNFGVIYGQTESGLASALGITREEASEFIAAYYRKYEGVRTAMQGFLTSARSSGMATTLFGRRRLLSELDHANRAVRLAAERMAMNMPIQGTAADLQKLAMLAVDRLCPADWHMVLTVHDELVLEVPLADAERAMLEIRHAMEDVAALSVPLLVEAKHGRSWAEAH